MRLQVDGSTQHTMPNTTSPVGAVEPFESPDDPTSSAAPERRESEKVITDWDDKEARATTDVVFLAQREASWAVQIVARYHDVFRPVGGRWLISRRADEYIGWQPPD